MMEIIPDLPDNVVGVSGSEIITGEDYDNVLIPAVKDKLKKYDKTRLIYQLKENFSHYTLDAYLEDSKIS